MTSGADPGTVVAAQDPSPDALVLASGSKWRRSLLTDAGIISVADPARIDESAVTADDPVRLAGLRASAKAADVAGRWPGRVVLGADQVVHLDGEPFGKPPSDEAWLRMLKRLRGRVHQLTTAVTLMWPEAGGGHVAESFAVHTAIRFRADLEDAELEAYVANGEARGCAGGYMVERSGAWLIEAVDGDWTNVVGLPVLAVIGRLRARGWRFGQAVPAGDSDGPQRDD